MPSGTQPPRAAAFPCSLLTPTTQEPAASTLPLPRPSTRSGWELPFSRAGKTALEQGARKGLCWAPAAPTPAAPCGWDACGRKRGGGEKAAGSRSRFSVRRWAFNLNHIAQLATKLRHFNQPAHLQKVQVSRSLSTRMMV